MDVLTEKILKTVTDNRMIEPGDRILVGVSGGPDSVALLHGLMALAPALEIELVIVHLNHRARGPESDEDARFVRRLGESLTIETVIGERDVPTEHEKSRHSFQETARNIRQEFFEEVRRQSGACKVALGHTSDDQVETMLMNLLRGSGLKGLGGMRPVRDDYIRPLFDCTRDEIIEFLQRNGISWRLDSSNEKTDYLRNRIRSELIPFLKEDFNPRIAENLHEASAILRDDNDLLIQMTDQEFSRVVSSEEQEGSIEIDLDRVRSLGPAIKRRLIRKAIHQVKGNLRAVTSFHIQEILQLFHAGRKGKKLDLPGPVQVVCLGERVAIKRIPEDGDRIKNEEVDCHWSGKLVVPGELKVGSSGVTLKAELVNPVEARYHMEHSHQAFLDYEKTGGNIQVRFFQPGDRLHPLGMTGTKKLKSLFIDEKVPREHRAKVPILTTGENDIIWVYGSRIAHPYRVTSETKTILFIKGIF